MVHESEKSAQKANASLADDPHFNFALETQDSKKLHYSKLLTKKLVSENLCISFCS
jgi:hypothetical protein